MFGNEGKEEIVVYSRTCWEHGYSSPVEDIKLSLCFFFLLFILLKIEKLFTKGSK